MFTFSLEYVENDEKVTSSLYNKVLHEQTFISLRLQLYYEVLKGIEQITSLEVKEFKYLVTTLCKLWGMVWEMREASA